MTIILTFLFVLTFLQTQNAYSPLTPGNKWTYKTEVGSFEVQVSKENFIHNKIEYLQSVRKYSDGTSDIIYNRIGKENAIVYYLDTESFKESVEIPANPRINYMWTSADNLWKYRVTEVGTTLNVPGQVFNHCIAIKAQSMVTPNETYVNYYARDLGYVATKTNGSLTTYLIRWTVKAAKKS